MNRLLDNVLLGADYNDHVARFVFQLIYGCDGDFNMPYSFGFLDATGLLEAGIILHDYHPERETIELSAASLKRTWITVDRLNLVADYVFNQLGCYTLVARHDPSNAVARRLWKRIGGTEHILPNLRGAGKDDCMHILSVEEARQSKFWRL